MLFATTFRSSSIAGSFAVAALYLLSFWRILKTNRGNKVIECGSIALMTAFLLMVLVKVPNLPEWVQPSLGLLLLLLCLLTLFFLFLQGLQAIRNRNPKIATPSFSLADHVVRELGYDPHNVRVKWLLRFTYWGTVLLVATLFWEYVKAK